VGEREDRVRCAIPGSAPDDGPRSATIIKEETRMDCTACPGTCPDRAARRAGPAFGLAAALALQLGACGGAPQPERPTLAVLVVVDQLWADLLVRYDSLFTGGLRRLRDESRQFVNATHDHGGTYTAPGHATLSTGVYP